MPTVPMMQDHPRNSVLESWYVRALDKALRSLAESFTIRKAAGSDTIIEVPATADRTDGAPAAISVDGAWRFNEVTVQRAHPGGANGTYGIFVTAKNNSITNVPQPFTDNTDYSFALAIVAGAGTPVIVPGSVDRFRKVGELDWTTGAITRLQQYVGDVDASTPRAAGFATTIGNGVASSFLVSHGLGTPDVVVVVRDVATGERVEVEWRVTTDNQVTIVTDLPPAAASLRVLVMAATTATPPAPVGSFGAVIGDGVQTSWTVTHNLGTRDLVWDVYRTVAPFDSPRVNVSKPTVNTLLVEFEGYVPAAGEFGVFVTARGGLQGAAAQHAAQHRGGGSDPIWTPGALTVVRTVGEVGQVQAGRTLTVADFTALGLAPPLGLWNLADLSDVSGNGRALTNKGAVPFGPGINGAAAEAAVFAGATTQALYIADTGAGDPLRIRTGSWFGWFRSAKRATGMYPFSKTGATNAVSAWQIAVTTQASLGVYDGTTVVVVTGATDVCDDRWHFIVGTHDGSRARLYVDGALDAIAVANFPLNAAATAPFNIGGWGADAGTAAGGPFNGRVQVAGVLSDVLDETQIRALMARSIPHGQAGVPSLPGMRVTRRRRGALVARTDVTGLGLAEASRVYNLDDLNDDSVNAVPLTANPGTGAIVQVAGPDGSAGTARSYSGAHTGDSATDAGLPAALAARSGGAWFKYSGAGTGDFLAWGTALTADFRLGVTTGILQSASGADGMSGGQVGDGLWHFAFVVEDNAAADWKRKLYLDGRLVGGSNVLTSLTLAGAARFRLGAASDGTRVFTGQLGRGIVLPYAVTPEQVRALYALSKAVLTPVSPKDAADNIEYMDALNLYVVHNDLEPQDQIELVAA